MITTNLCIVLLAFIGLDGIHAAAIGDVSRNVQSELVLLDAGLNPQPRRSRRLNLDVPAGNFCTFYTLVEIYAGPFLVNAKHSTLHSFMQIGQCAFKKVG